MFLGKFCEIGSGFKLFYEIFGEFEAFLVHVAFGFENVDSFVGADIILSVAVGFGPGSVFDAHFLFGGWEDFAEVLGSNDGNQKFLPLLLFELGSGEVGGSEVGFEATAIARVNVANDFFDLLLNSMVGEVLQVLLMHAVDDGAVDEFIEHLFHQLFEFPVVIGASSRILRHEHGLHWGNFDHQLIESDDFAIHLGGDSIDGLGGLRSGENQRNCGEKKKKGFHGVRD